jgi:hypothetical protein
MSGIQRRFPRWNVTYVVDDVAAICDEIENATNLILADMGCDASLTWTLKFLVCLHT